MIKPLPSKIKDLLQNVINGKEFDSIVEMNRKQYFSKGDIKIINKMKKKIINERIKIIALDVNAADLAKLEFKTALHNDVFDGLYIDAMVDAEYEGILFTENGEQFITSFGLHVAQTGYLRWKKFEKIREILYDFQIPILIFGMMIIEFFI